jgi:fucose 4-O-acetylase-like acetyltransferase
MKKINLFANSSSAAAIDPDTLQSQVIDLLRFPLIVGVVFIHATLRCVTVSGIELGSADVFPLYHLCDSLFVEVLGGVCVPLFFLISGFLFFWNVDFNGRSYLRKLQSRVRTLLIPYLFWIFVTLLLMFAVRTFIRGLDSFESGYNIDFTPRYALFALWGTALEGGKVIGPIVGQFWFIRDLMVLVVLTPLVHVYIKRLRLYGVVLLCLLWFFGWWIKVPGFSATAFFFFTAGAWLSVNKRNLALEAAKLKYLAFTLYPLLVVVDLLTRGCELNFCVHHLCILVGILFWLNVGVSSIRTTVITTAKYKATKAASLVGFNHINEKFLMGTESQGEWTVKTKNDAAARNLLGTITVVLIGLGLYYVLRRFLPSFTNIITGGR